MADFDQYLEELTAVYQETRNPAVAQCLQVMYSKLAPPDPGQQESLRQADIVIRQRLNAAIAASNAGSYQEAVQIVSSVLAECLPTLIEPLSQDVVEAIKALMSDESALTKDNQTRLGFVSEMQKVNSQPAQDENNIHIFVAAMPRSASSLMIRILKEITNFSFCPPRSADVRTVPFSMFADLNASDWNIAAFRKNTVGKQHLRIATNINCELLKNYDTKVVFQYRNIFDAIVSLVDHHSQFPERTLWRSTWDTMSYEEKIDSFITFYVPDYLRMYYTFMKNDENLNLMYMSYDQFTGEMESSINDILEFAGTEIGKSRVSEVVGQYDDRSSSPNFNRGVKGRGLEKMTAEQKKRITDMTLGLGDVDFSLIGIENATA